MRSAARFRAGARFPRCRLRSRRRARAAGGSPSCRTRTATSSPHRSGRSAFRSTRSSSRPRSAPTRRSAGTGRSSRRAPAPTRPVTCTSPRACSTTSRQRTRSGSRTCGSTAPASAPRGRPRSVSCPIWLRFPRCSMSSSLLELRHPSRADAERVAEVLIAFEERILGESEWSLEELEREWRDTQLERDAWMALDGERVVGYVALSERNDVWEFDGYVHPDRFGEGIGTLLVEHGEREAGARGSRVARTPVLGADEPALELLRDRGYDEVRRFYRMAV